MIGYSDSEERGRVLSPAPRDVLCPVIPIREKEVRKAEELLSPLLTGSQRSSCLRFLVFGKCGQLGKGLTVPATFVFVLVILVLFLALVAGIITFKQVHAPVIASPELGSSLLLRTVSVSVDGTEQKMLVFEALVQHRRGKIDRATFEKSLQQLVSAEQQCFAFAHGTREHPARSSAKPGDAFFFSFQQNPHASDPEYLPSTLAQYERAGVMHELVFSLQGTSVYVESYLGRCLDG